MVRADQGRLRGPRTRWKSALACGMSPSRQVFRRPTFADCGPVVVAYGDTQEDADAAADALYHYIAEREEQFVVPLLTPAEAVPTGHAGPRRQTHSAGRRAGQLRRWCDLRHHGHFSRTGAPERQDAVVGVLVDAEAAQAAHAAGLGGTLDLAIGGKVFTGGDPPLRPPGRWWGCRTVALPAPARFTRACATNLGRMAYLKTGWRGRHRLDASHASCRPGHVSSHRLRADGAKNSRAQKLACISAATSPPSPPTSSSSRPRGLH